MTKSSDSPESGRSPTTGSTGKPPGFFRRFVESFKLARDLGTLSKAVTPMNRPSVMLSRMEDFANVFMGQTGWLTGGMPLTPKLEPGSPPRKFQYQPGTNINIQPRSTEDITFSQLRSLGDYTLIRIVIERVKESIKAHEWDIIAEDGHEGANYEADIKIAKDFLESPDRRNSWDEWIGMVMEEVLVPDALSIYVHRTRNGKLWGMEVIDGGTIKPVIDERGFEPLSPAPAYQQFLYGVPYVNLTRDELIYRPRNRRANKFYGFSPVEQIVITINQGFRRELYNLAQFTDGTIPAAFASLPPDWKAEEIKQWQEYWDAVLTGDPQNRSKIRWMPGGPGVGITKMRDEEVFGLHNKFDEWLARIVAYAFGMSPTSFVQMTNRAVSQEMGDVEAEQGLASIKLFLERLVNEIIDDYLLLPHLRFNWVTDRSRMQTKTVNRNVEYAKAGIFQIDEIRAEEGKKPLGLPPGVITATGYVPFALSTNPNAMIPQSAPAIPHGQPGHQTPAGPASDEEEMASRPVGPPSRLNRQQDPRDQIPQAGMATREPNRVIGPVGMKALMVCRADEMDKWERFAVSRLEKGKQASPFVVEFMENEEAQAIASELTKTASIDQIRHVFSSRRKRLPEVRLAPPRAGDAAHLKNDLKTALRGVLEAEAHRVAREKEDK